MSEFRPESLARTAVRELEPYSSARSEGLDAAIYLDANESPYQPDLAVPSEVVSSDIQRYPEPQPRSLVAAFSELYGVPGAGIFIGRGTDDAIDALLRTFCEAGRDRIAVCSPTYGMYRVSAGIQGAGVIDVPLLAEGGYQLDLPALIAAARDAKVVFVCSPNNPTGQVIARADIAQLCAQVPGLVVVDEAYIDFCPDKSVVDMLADQRNLVVLRTLSKAWALAGARCGVALGDPAVIDLLHRVRAPYPLSRPAIALVERALTPAGRAACESRVAQLIAARTELAAALAEVPGAIRVFPSDSNFVLVEVDDPAAWMARCRAAGILIRDRSRAVPGCVRITVGSPEQNRAVLAALAGASLARSNGPRATRSGGER
ncbi:MAG: histidinol-phosphate transaminase [Myxococcota bacterium]